MSREPWGGPRFAVLRMLAGAAVISFSAVFVKFVSVPPTVSAMYRVLFGSAILFVWLLARRERIDLRGRTLWVLSAAAFFFALDLAFWHRSIVYVGPGLATLLGNFQVFFMALGGALLLRERLTWRAALAMPLALFGLALIVGLDVSALSIEMRLGVSFGLLTAMTYAAYLLTLRAAQSQAARSPAADLAIISLISAVMLAALALAEGASLSPGSPRDVGWLLLYALVSQAVGWLLIASAVAHLSAARVGLIMLLQPVLALTWDSLIFARSFTAVEAAGAAIALLAIYLGTRASRSAKASCPPPSSSL